MRRWRVLLTALILLLVLGQPALTRGGRVVFGQDYHLAPGQRLEGGIVVLGGDVVLEPGSSARGDVLALGGSVRVAGRLEGRAQAPGGDVILTETALVQGDVVAAGRVLCPPGAVVQGRMVEGRQRWLLGLPGLWFGWPWGLGAGGNPLLWAAQALLGSLVAVAAGVLVVLLLPRPMRTVSQAVAGFPLQSLALGLLAWLAALLSVPALAITVIGIPAAVATVAVVALGTILAWVAVGLAAGERLLVALHRPGPSPHLAVAAGLGALALLASIPCLGLVVAGLAAVWGVGALLLTRLGTLPFEGTPPSAGPPS